MGYFYGNKNKYGAKRTGYNGRTYDSKGEARLAQDIELLRRGGAVIKVEPQKDFGLHGKNGGKICSHRVDFFLTFKDGHSEIWEFKGFSTPVFRLKLKLFKDNYPDTIYNIVTAR